MELFVRSLDKVVKEELCGWIQLGLYTIASTWVEGNAKT